MKRFVEPEWTRPGLRKYLIFLAAWTVIGLFFASQFYISSSKAGVPVSLAQALLWSLGDWYVFALLSIPASLVARRFPIEKGVWRRHVVVHLAASVAFSLTYVLLRGWIGQIQGNWLSRPVSYAEVFLPLLLKTWHFNLLIYWVIVSVVHAMENSRKFRERERRSIELERGLVEARLQVLQMQLNPHFLFNALHSISALMHRDVEAADRMIARLGELLRYSLESSEEHEVELERELEILELYLDIEQTRFEARLSVNFHISTEVREALVPNLILQPIVENAIRHGIEPIQKPGLVEVRASRQGAMLLLEVTDNGAGWRVGAREGVGMTNTRARLRTLHGDAAEVQVGAGEVSGSVVRVRFPFRLRAHSQLP